MPKRGILEIGWRRGCGRVMGLVVDSERREGIMSSSSSSPSFAVGILSLGLMSGTSSSGGRMIGVTERPCESER